MVKTKEQLETEGWKLASATGGDHLKRALDMYHELGIEIYILRKSNPKSAEAALNVTRQATRPCTESTPEQTMGRLKDDVAKRIK